MRILHVKVLAILSLSAFAATAQVPSVDELWEGIAQAANGDIYAYHLAMREKNKAALTDAIQSQLADVQRAFLAPYAAESIDHTLGSVESLIANPNITPEQSQAAEQLYGKCSGYESAARALYSQLTLDAGNPAFERVGKLLCRPEMAPIFVEWMAHDIKGVLEEQGFYDITFDADYQFLNDKLSHVKERLAALSDSPDGEADQLLSELRTVLNTVNEISPDFPQVTILLDQEFKTDEE